MDNIVANKMDRHMSPKPNVRCYDAFFLNQAAVCRQQSNGNV